MNDFLQKIIIEPFGRFLEQLSEFLPKLFSFIFIVILGFMIAFIVKALFLRIFQAVKLDSFSEKQGMKELLAKSGIGDPVSLLLSKLISWLTVICFFILGLRAIDFPAVEQILERLFLFLPNFVIVAFILFFGYFFGNFFGRAALIACVNAGFHASGTVGKLVKITVIALAVTMALEQLGIGKETIIIAFAIIFGGIVLAVSIAFGLGGRDIAKDYLEKKVKGEEKKDDISHL